MEIDFTKALAGVTALAAALAALAAATGAFDQMQRNEPQWSAAVFSAAVIAGVLLVAAGWTNGILEIVLAIAALIAFVFAAVAGIVFMIQARGERPAPSIKVSFKTAPRLAVSGSIKAEQLTARESLKVRVLVNRPTNDSNPNGIGAEDRLYDARVGPDGSGTVELPLDVPIPEKTYRWVNVLAWVAERPDGCFTIRPQQNFRNTPGCVVMHVPEGSSAP